MSHRKMHHGGKKKSKRKWIQAANEKMEEKGTKGSFGKATKSNIARGKKEGGKMKKKAIFAENMKRIAAKRKHGHKRHSRKA